jgi:LPXTG-site transpeptidase (sortase) family protein
MRASLAIVAGCFLLLWAGALSVDGVVTYEFAPRPGEASGAVFIPPPEEEAVGRPVRITIPSIGVDAKIEEVALTKNGAMDVPKLPHDTAWYGLGPRPGAAGSAAIAGHVDWLDGSAAVFADLHKVKPGDAIAVQDDEGEVTSFVVRESRRYDADAEARDVFASNDGKSHLSVITCDGAWDKRAGQYARRLVVFADKSVN